MRGSPHQGQLSREGGTAPASLPLKGCSETAHTGGDRRSGGASPPPFHSARLDRGCLLCAEPTADHYHRGLVAVAICRRWLL